MKASDWIALGQALLLAAAAFAAWRGYALAVAEHREARFEARKAPLRALFADIVENSKISPIKPRNVCQVSGANVST